MWWRASAQADFTLAGADPHSSDGLAGSLADGTYDVAVAGYDSTPNANFGVDAARSPYEGNVMVSMTNG